jgi:hypothetical protein
MRLFAALRTRPSRWVFFAVALFVLDTLAPALAAIRGVASPAAFVEICTSAGFRRVAVNDGASATPGKTCFKCPLCAIAGGHVLIDPPRHAWVVADVCKFAAPSVAMQRPVAQGGQRRPPARGPPAYS